MRHRLDVLTVDGRMVWVSAPAGGEAEGMPVIYMVVGDGFDKEHEAIIAALEGLAAGPWQDVPFVLAAAACEDWNRWLTPWPALALFKKEGDFAGNGGIFLDWMIQTLMPYTEKAYPVRRDAAGRAIAGYSLAGLFALWALYEKADFSACASCSGSLWYDGWMQYVQQTGLEKPCSIYLSLGDKEEHARNERMARVGDVTREMAAMLEKNPDVKASALAWNAGGHFADVPLRQAKAIAWLLAQYNHNAGWGG